MTAKLRRVHTLQVCCRTFICPTRCNPWAFWHSLLIFPWWHLRISSLFLLFLPRGAHTALNLHCWMMWACGSVLGLCLIFLEQVRSIYQNSSACYSFSPTSIAHIPWPCSFLSSLLRMCCAHILISMEYFDVQLNLGMYCTLFLIFH